MEQHMQPHPVKLDMNMLYDLFDELTIQDLQALIQDIQQEIDLRNYKAIRVNKIKELMDQERDKLRQEIDNERMQFKQQLEKDKNKLRLQSVEEEEYDEETEEEPEELPAPPPPKPKRKIIKRKPGRKLNK